MKREAFKMFLKPGFEKEYEKRHAAIWPELKKMLSDGGVYDYSIYWDTDSCKFEFSPPYGDGALNISQKIVKWKS